MCGNARGGPEFLDPSRPCTEAQSPALVRMARRSVAWWHSARILCSPGVCGTANSSGGAGVPAFLSRCQESHAEYTRSWLPSSLALKALSGLSSFHGSHASSPSLSTGGFADSSGHGVGRLLVGLVETRLCSWGSQPLHHRSAPALSRPRCSCVHLSRCAVGRLNPSFGGQPPLDH